MSHTRNENPPLYLISTYSIHVHVTTLVCKFLQDLHVGGNLISTTKTVLSFVARLHPAFQMLGGVWPGTITYIAKWIHEVHIEPILD